MADMLPFVGGFRLGRLDGEVGVEKANNGQEDG